MSARWDDLNARVRGLSTHLLRDDQLAALATRPDLGALAAALAQAGYPVGPGAGLPTPAHLEQAVRRQAASRFRLLARWCGPRAATLAILFEDEDRRSLRALARGAAEGVASSNRLEGLIPTPSLPERALHELAKLRSPGQMGGLLAVWGHPYAAPLLEATTEGPPDLYRLEGGLSRRFVARARQAARAGDWVLREYVATVVDLENLCSALLVIAEDPAAPLQELWLPGGARLGVEELHAAARTGSVRGGLELFGARFKDTGFGAVLAEAGDDLSGLEDRLQGAFLVHAKRLARLEPLSTAPILAYVLGIRAEVGALQRIIWGTALGAPATVRRLDPAPATL